MAEPVLLAFPILVCPNCQHRVQAKGRHPHPVHRCKGLGGLYAPLVPEGIKAKTEAVPREDYVNGEVVQRDHEGRVAMAVEVTRDDGTDRAVLAPCAIGHANG